MDNQCDSTGRRKETDITGRNALKRRCVATLEAVQIDPLYADAWYNLGMTCRALGYLDEAVTCFERAKKYRPAGGNAHIPRAHLRDHPITSPKRLIPAGFNGYQGKSEST